ncbi:MAG: CRISPR-associated endonuclease Cas1 [Acidobacteria bacterium]|nr:CRISPR-associated endonuclease Cas1 [Acidobacteriota bacterium]
MLNEFVYCRRLFFYEWVDGLFAHSADTLDGAHRHERHDRKEDELLPPDEAERIHARSVTLSSDTHGLIAKLDLIEGDGAAATPVDYKRGSPKDTEAGPEAWPADRMQLVAQALVLREHGYEVKDAVAYYYETKQRVRVAIDDDIVGEAVAALAEARAIAALGRIPSPLVDSPKCPRCSLVGICLPDETRRAMGLEPLAPESQVSLFGVDTELAGDRPLDSSSIGPEIRQLFAARDDLRPLYITGFGLTVGKSDDVLQVRDKKQLVQEVRMHDISQVNVFGAVTVTGPALQSLCWAEKPVAHFTSGGWFAGMTSGMGLKNVFLRIAQVRQADDPRFTLAFAREAVATKIRNQRTLLQRNHVEPSRAVLARLKALADDTPHVTSLESLLGVEGTAARLYFEGFAGMLKPEGDDELPSFEFGHRNRRPPRDPVNALLSFAYALLTKDLTIVCHAVGFDPFIGFYHQPRFGRPALALDLMEGFRPLIADSAVLSVVNTRMVTTKDFIHAGRAVTLTASGRKALLRAYEQRMDNLVTHPLFGYRVSYRRVLELQARLLARVVTGELPRYPGFETR